MIAALLLLGAAQEPVSYHQDVRPLLRARCAGCHHGDDPDGKLDLTTHAGVLAGGRHDDVVVPGDPGASLLIEMVSPFEDLPPEMPPEDEGDPLTGSERALLARWIAEGAVDDTPEPAAAAAPPEYPRLPIVTDLAVSPDGALLAVTGRGEVLLHDLEAGGVVARLVGRAPRLEALAFSPDGSLLAAAGGTPGVRGELQVWDVASRTQRHAIEVTSDTLYGASWSGDGTRVAFGGPDRVLRAVDAASGEQVLFQMSHEDWVLDTVWSTDDSHLVSVSRDRSMNLVQVSTQQFIDKITSITPGALKGGLMAVDRHPEKDELLIGGADGVPKLFRTYREKKRVIGDDYNLIRAFEPLTGRAYDVTFAADGALVAAVSSHAAGGEVRVARTDDGATVWTRALPTGQYAVAFHPDGARVLAAGFDGHVRVFDADDGVLRSTFESVPLAPEATR